MAKQAPEPSDNGLSAAEQRFVAEYLIDLNGAAAYRRTFPQVSHTSAAVMAARLLARPRVRDELRAARRMMQVRTQVKADCVLQELARAAFADILDVYDPDTGMLRRPRSIPYHTRKVVQSIEVKRVRRQTMRGRKSVTHVTEEIVEVKLVDKVKALKELCRYLGIDQSPLPPFEDILPGLPPEAVALLRSAVTPRGQRVIGGRRGAG